MSFSSVLETSCSVGPVAPHDIPHPPLFFFIIKKNKVHPKARGTILSVSNSKQEGLQTFLVSSLF